MRGTIVCLTCALAMTGRAAGQSLNPEHRALLEEGFRLFDHVEDRWPDWASAPEAVLMVSGDWEFLFGHPAPDGTFRVTTESPVAGRPVLVRERAHPPGLLATFPAVGGVSTIVIGTPEATGLNPTRWILTLLHEHFHQLQMSRPGYYVGVEALGLSGGDDSGMWMLEYPFPYSDPSVSNAVGALGRAARALAGSAREGEVPDQAVRGYLGLREALTRTIRPEDNRYLAFQTWQEGVARYAELDAAIHAAQTFAVSDRFRALPGFVPFDVVADSLWKEIEAAVDRDLTGSARVYFYALGALEAVALEALRPGWRERYAVEPFDLSRYWHAPG